MEMTTMGDKFKDKVVIVTGGSRGLGRAISVGFAREGAQVVVASRKIAACQEVVALIEEAGGTGMAYAAHMGEVADLDALIAAAYERFGRVDVLVNNAGINVALGPLSEITTTAFDKMVDVNLKGAWYLASRLAPRMGEHGGGCVINMLSVAALCTPRLLRYLCSNQGSLEGLDRGDGAGMGAMEYSGQRLGSGKLSLRSDRWRDCGTATLR
tara:strand:+ start:296 stop:931 length:636 start_codon:yes stop_codon:yes gene_type:complete